MGNKNILFIVFAAGVAALWLRRHTYRAEMQHRPAPAVSEATLAASDVRKSSLPEAKVNTGRVEKDGGAGPDAETYEESLQREGYIQDDRNPDLMVKTITDNKGREQKIYANKTDEGFDPILKTEKGARELLAAKWDLNPAEEILNLHPLDESVQDNLMLSGTFRDDTQDLEMRFGLGGILPPELNPVCFISPWLGIDVPWGSSRAVLRVDETGYAILKIDAHLYARFTWAYEKRRTLYGEILRVNGSYIEKLKDFAAREVLYEKGETADYCRPRVPAAP